MKTRKKKLLLGILTLALLVACSAGFYFRQSFQGYYAYKFKKWEEDSFRGMPLEQLHQDLIAREQSLVWCDVEGFYARTHRTLKDGQRVMSFTKGGDYPWFSRYVTVQNGAYIIIQNTPQGDIVADIVRVVFIDSP